MNSANQTSGRGCDIPPDPSHVDIYFLQCKKSREAASEFYRHYSRRYWRAATGKVIQDWKRLAWQWIWNRSIWQAAKAEKAGNALAGTPEQDGTIELDTIEVSIVPKMESGNQLHETMAA